MSKKPIILGIESSCDETAASIVTENDQGHTNNFIKHCVQPG